MKQNASEPSLQEKLRRQIDVLQRVDAFMGTLTDLDQLLNQIMQESQGITDAEASSLALYDERRDEFVFHVVLGEKGSALHKQRLKSTEGIIGQVALTGKSQNIQDAYANRAFASHIDKKTGFTTRSILAVPMARHGRLIGVIEVLNKSAGTPFTEDDQTILEMLAHQAAIAIENARLYQENIEQERLASLGSGISGAAHCIKNILNLITMGSSGVDLGIQKANPALIAPAWDTVRKGCDRIEQMVLDMLSYSRSRTPEYRPVNVNELLAETARLVRNGLYEKQIELVEEYDPEAGTLMLDEAAINRCLLNLISNAADAIDSGRDGRITLTTHIDPQAGEVEVRVADNGSGIAKDMIPQIFDVFFSTKGSQGTGLGLSVTKKIIEEHGGTIEAASQEGTGSTFSIRLPAHNR